MSKFPLSTAIHLSRRNIKKLPPTAAEAHYHHGIFSPRRMYALSMACAETLQRALAVAEFCIAVSAVILFGIAHPDRFRSRLWEDGGAHGWNSDPKMRIYFYANHKEPPEIPLIWSQRLTDSNLSIAILALVVAVVRIVTKRLGYLPRSASMLYDGLLAVLWATSIAGQTSGDASDPEHVSQWPWYLERGCGGAWTRDRAWCRVARASFAVSVLAVVLYVGRLVGEVARLWVERRAAKEMERWESLFGWKAGDDDSEAGEEGFGMERRPYEEALSPVLAFFP